MGCYVEDCDHPADYMDGTSCACHLDIQFYYTLSKEDQVEVIRRAGLESDRFEVNSGGEVRLKDDDLPSEG